MITFKLTLEDKEIEYHFKNTLDDINIKDYFEITSIIFKKTEKPVDEKKKYVDGTYDKEYYSLQEEPEEIKLDKRIKVVSYLSGVDYQLFVDYPELLLELEDVLEPLNFNETVWKTKPVTKGRKNTETNQEWTYDDPEQWSFQQWVDAENASKTSLIYPYLIALYKREKGTRKKRKYDRSHPEWEEIEAYWLRQPARDNVSVIYHILSRMADVRSKFYYVYEAQSSFTDNKENGNTKAYNEFAGWNDVVVSLAEQPFFNSPSGTLNAVRNANCIEVLELLNWKRGKSFAEYEDYKVEERSRELNSKLKR